MKLTSIKFALTIANVMAQRDAEKCGEIQTRI